MANLIRSGKPGSAWTSNDLASYNIQISNVSEEAFFEFDNDTLELPESLTGSLAHLTTVDAEAAGDEEAANLLFIMQEAQSGADAFVDEFASRMLKKLGYESEGRMVLINESLWFESGGTMQEAQTDVCVMNRKRIMPLVQGDERTSQGDIVGNEPQLIAEAIGAFAGNQRGAL